jgi:hypothetical protein
MADTTKIVDSYIATWNERHPALRRVLVEATFAADADYLDPLMNGRGIEQIDAMIGAAQEQFPGHSFTLVAGPDEHNDCLRFSWQLGPAEGDAVAGGTDFAQYDEDGRLRSVTGFLDPVA